MNTPRSPRIIARIFKALELALAVSALLAAVPAWATLDIPSLTWTQRADWLNVKSAPYNAVGDGVADDTAAIQAALTVAGASGSPTRTVYLPAGTYKITSTLNWQGTNIPWTYGAGGVALIGCGRDTTIRWAGSTGGAMFLSSGETRARFIGISWDGDNLAGAAYAHISTHLYQTRMRHENEAFRNFTVPGTYVSGTTYPASALITGLNSQTAPTAETLIWNCLFNNCSTGVMVGYQQYNSYQWFIEGCQFENCGTGVSAPDGKTIIYNTHFEGSTVADIYTTAGLDQSISRCTSHGSKAFFTVAQGGSATPQVLQDCWIDSWTSTTAAVELDSRGPSLLFDCVFTNPPNTVPPIRLNNSPSCPARLLLSNNYFPPTVTAPVNPGPISVTVNVPPGGSGGTATVLSSATTTFLSTTWPADSANIIDVTLPPYNAKKDNSVDVTAAIQSAIDAARTANNGSIVYLPLGTYKIGSTLSVSGSNYTLQGSGWQSILYWSGTDSGTVIAVTSPNNLTLQQFQIQGNSTVAGVRHTATTAGDMTYDGVYYSANGSYNLDGAGVQLVNLPTGAHVFIDHLDAPLTVTDCGRAEILAKWLIQGRLIVNGATYAKTGFLGISNFQGGQMTAGDDLWDLLVDDNQDLVIGHWYQEQGYNHLKARRGNGTGTGRLTIKGVKQNLNAGYTTIQVDNYLGRILYGPQAFANSTSTVINQTGTNAVDLILAGDVFASAVPTITTDTGCNLITTQILCSTSPYTYPSDTLPTGGLASIAASYDHYRQLGAEDMKLSYGIQNTVANSFFETDALNASPQTTRGTTPASWTVSGGTSAGLGVRSVSAVSPGSPFSSGTTQSANFVDTTGTSIGTRLEFGQNTATLSATEGAVFSFDVRLNSMTSLNDDVWVRVFANATAASFHLTASGTSGAFGPAALTLDTWYRIRAVLQAPSQGTQNIALTVTPWTSTGPGTPSTYTVTGSLTAASTYGFTRIFFNEVNPGSNTNINLDNITLVTGDPLLP